MLQLTSVAAAGTIILTVLAAMLLVYRLAPARRKHNRRLTTLLALFLFAWGAAKLVTPLTQTWVQPLALAAAEAFGFFTLVAVGGVIVFDLALPLIRVDLPTIAAELFMGLCYLAAAVVVMRRSGFHPTSIVAGGAVLTGVLALSLQATLGNILGGVALQLDDSIHVGDWVQLENGKQGLVRQIRWRHTIIETRDWTTIIMPNAVLLGSAFIILGKRIGQPVQYRMWVYFNVDFRYNPAEVIEITQAALRATPIPGVANEPPPNCICYDLAKDGRDSLAYYAVRYWLTDPPNDDPTNSAVRCRIYAALKRAEIPLAMPAMQVWVDQDSPERRARKVEREMGRRRAALEAVSFLAPLHESELANLAERLHHAPFAAGEVVTREGAVAHWLYIITAGEAEVRIAGASGQRTVAVLKGPDVVGEMGLMTGEPRAASVIARTDVDCYRLDKDAFHSVLAERPALAAEITQLMAARQVELRALKQGERPSAAHVEAESVRMLKAVRRFFGLDATE